MIAWPSGLAPEVASLHVHNELETDVEPEQIWPWLVRASRWPELYPNARRIRMPGPELTLGMEFSWWTFAVPVVTIVDELVPFERLAWRGTGLGAKGYHAWLLERRDGRTRFVTEESQQGFLPSLLRFAVRPGLLHFHQRWLEGLVSAARVGHPDTVTTLRR
jgi:hypothetical protein